jgi:hypothetical protein
VKVQLPLISAKWALEEFQLEIVKLRGFFGDIANQRADGLFNLA